MSALLSPVELEARLKAIGAERYHNKHPFHLLMNSGALTKDQLRAWALNRYCYQATIPIKDAVILSRMTDPAMRRITRRTYADQARYTDSAWNVEHGWTRSFDNGDESAVEKRFLSEAIKEHLAGKEVSVTTARVFG